MTTLSSQLEQVCARMVDPRLGIVRRIAEVPLQPGEPGLFIVAARCTRPKYFLRNEPTSLPGTDYDVAANGVAFEKEDALWSALGEVCERYSGGLYFEEALLTASRIELGRNALPVEDLIAFSHAQYARPGFPFVRFDPHAPIRWVRGWNLTRREPAFIPAVLVFLGYEAQSPLEAFYPTTSTGMAAGRTLEQALLNALYEVVERDAFTCTWLLRHPPHRIERAVLKKGLSSREWRLLTNKCADATVLLMTTDLDLPCVATVLRQRGRRSIVIGAAANSSLRQAVIRSALEAFHTLNWAIFLERTPRTVAREEVREFEDHVRYYLDERNFDKAAWLLEGPSADVVLDTEGPGSPGAPANTDAHGEPVHQDDLAARLEATVASLERAGYEVYYVETTTADVRSLGFRTVRVIVPGLQPLNMGYDTVHEDDRRLRRVAAHHGIAMPDRLNSEPHPFP